MRIASPINPNEPPFIRVRGLKRSFGEQEVLRGVDLEIPSGRTTAILGASGGGKSVLLRLLIGLMDPDEGTIEIEGEEITRMGERQLGKVRRKIGMLFQNGALFDSMTVRENVVFPLRETGLTDEDALEKRALEALGMVGLAEHLEKMPNALSGGMRKRVALARAIISRPAAVFYDEPTAGLDPIVSDQINHLILRTQQKLGITQVVVTHDMRSLYHVADHVAFLRDGKIYFTGSPQDLRHCRDENVREFILGRSRESIEAGWPEPGPCDPLPAG